MQIIKLSYSWILKKTLEMRENHRKKGVYLQNYFYLICHQLQISKLGI